MYMLTGHHSAGSDDEIKALADEICLNGKTIKEWKQDCETFYAQKLAAEEALLVNEYKFSIELNELAEARICADRECRQLTEENQKLTEKNRLLNNMLVSNID